MDYFPDIDAELCCPVCRDLLVVPMLHRPCSNSFCGSCLRQLLAAEAKCPICRLPLERGDLRRNGELEDLVVHMNVTCSCGRILQGPEVTPHLAVCTYEMRKRQVEYRHAQRKSTGVNRWTFACPVCPASLMNRESLRQHVKSHGLVAAACPVCALLPWNGQHREEDLAGHLASRHAFDLDTWVDFEMTEEQMLAAALRASETRC